MVGITHPTNLIPIDQYKCVVLCKRELRIYDLNLGKFVTKLKGVMNQKMPYYGLHNQNHLVALSRNRMYVNLMNIDSGKCIIICVIGPDGIQKIILQVTVLQLSKPEKIGSLIPCWFRGMEGTITLIILKFIKPMLLIITTSKLKMLL